MKYTVIPPCRELRRLVSHFWIGTWDIQTREPNTTYYVIASSLAEITFAFQSKERQADLLFSSIQGQTNTPCQFSVKGFCHLIGVSFYAHAAPYFFGIPASELHKEFMSLDTFLGYEGTRLTERMALANTSLQRLDLLSGYLISVLRKSKSADHRMLLAIEEIRRCRGNKRIEELAHDFYISQKQFSRRFKAFSGFSPKMFSRIIRFESAIKTYPSLSTSTDLAYANGYFDQAHFINEFKSFTGFSPTNFWKLQE